MLSVFSRVGAVFVEILRCIHPSRLLDPRINNLPVLKILDSFHQTLLLDVEEGALLESIPRKVLAIIVSFECLLICSES